jgi:DNA-binding NarL/FixJ family response regulator
MCEVIDAEPDIEICGEAESVAGALEQTELKRPDLALIDIGLGDENGIDLVGQMRALDHRVRMVIVSAHSERIYAGQSLRAGANGYICKADIMDNLIRAIRCVVAGETYVSGDHGGERERARGTASDQEPQGR